MGYIRSDFDEVKDSLEDLIGEEIIIVEPISKRGKKISKVATIENTFSSYFRVTFNDKKTANYNYADIFTKDIKIQIYDGDEFKPLRVPRPLTKKETIPVLEMDGYDLIFEELEDEF